MINYEQSVYTREQSPIGFPQVKSLSQKAVKAVHWHCAELASLQKLLLNSKQPARWRRWRVLCQKHWRIEFLETSNLIVLIGRAEGDTNLARRKIPCCWIQSQSINLDHVHLFL